MTADAPAPPYPYPQELVQFVFQPDQFRKLDVPRGLLPREIEAFARMRLHAGTRAAAFRQLVLVVDYYDSFEAAGVVLELLRRQTDAEADWERSFQMVRLVAAGGLPEERAEAAAEFDRLAATAETPERAATVVHAYDLFNPWHDPAGMERAFAARRAALAGPGGDARAAARFGELLNDLALVRRDREFRSAVESIPDRAARITREVALYLDLEFAPGYFVAWAARRLRRETWAPRVENQVMRSFDAALRAEVATAFRTALTASEATSDPPEEKLSRRIGALDAILFFGGDISADERQFLFTEAGTFIMPLSLRRAW